MWGSRTERRRLEAEATLRQNRVHYLIVDDDEAQGELVQRALKSNQSANSIVHVLSGEEALRYLEREAPFDSDETRAPDVLLLDIKMPGMNGHEVLEHVRKQEALKRMPVVMMSSSDCPDDVERSYENGANSYIVKPMDFNEFNLVFQNLDLYWTHVCSIPQRPSAEGEPRLTA